MDPVGKSYSKRTRALSLMSEGKKRKQRHLETYYIQSENPGTDVWKSLNCICS